MELNPVTERAIDRLESLSQISDDRECLTRTFLSGAMRRANILAGSWMQDVGMEASQDRAGTLVGRLESPEPTNEVLLIGSHLDTVRNAGSYDGALGVIVAIAALEKLRSEAISLRYNVDIVAFGDEEGVRYQSSFLSSRYFLGHLPKEELELLDADGISLGQALGALAVERPHAGYGPEEEFLGYVECHIEQGSRLEKKDLALGVVSGIIGQTRARFRIVGKCAHAGGASMEERRDALAGAAEVITMCESFALKSDGLVATVGCLDILNPASNTVPGEVTGTIDIRHSDDRRREEFCHRLEGAARERLEKRGLGFEFQVIAETPSTFSADRLTSLLEKSVLAVQTSCPVLESNAGHDAVAMAKEMGVAMLFVRCRDGLSHHPDEFVEPADIEVAIDAMARFLVALNELDS